jgi:hypothetical protein
VQVEVAAAVPGELVEFHEGSLVEQRPDPLPGGLPALGMPLVDRLRGTGVHRLVDPVAQVGQLAGGGVDVDVQGHLGAADPRRGGSHREPPEKRCTRRARSGCAPPCAELR